jgi:hypothetical protein
MGDGGIIRRSEMTRSATWFGKVRNKIMTTRLRRRSLPHHGFERPYVDNVHYVAAAVLKLEKGTNCKPWCKPRLMKARRCMSTTWPQEAAY